LTAAIEDLVGLTFDQFTKTVVLPQGDFARFLTETAGDRQGLLRRLLGLDLYAEMGSLARQRGRAAATELDALKAAIGDVEPISEAGLATLEDRASALEAAISALDLLEVSIAGVRDELDAIDRQADALDVALADLADLETPEGVPDLDRGVVAAMNALAKTSATLTKARQKQQLTIERRAELPATADLINLLERHDRRAELSLELGEAEQALDQSAAASEAALMAAIEARDALTSADQAVVQARMRAGAAGIASSLSIGDVCPVCIRVINDLPEHEPLDELDELEEELLRAGQAVRDATETVRATSADEAAAKARRDDLAAAYDRTQRDLSTAGSEASTRALLRTAEKADRAVETMDEEVRAGEQALDEATVWRSSLERREVVARREFVAARDRITAMSPPAPGEESVADDWRALTVWARSRSTELQRERKDLSTRRGKHEKEQARLERELRTLAAPHISEPVAPEETSRELRRAFEAASIRAQDARERLERDVANVARIEALEVETVVADQLGRHLSARGFEQWLMADVMHDLASRASARLAELSSGAFSLVTDGADFQIRDHRNADELRSARTLSGGETFLASLALALALAESITDVTASVTAPIESMFLDEGFGTLDSETLDIVAGAIEELGSSGRLIGIVTHIRELADRMPARIHVLKTGSSSTVSD
jgi:exonuclease SbcC